MRRYVFTQITPLPLYIDRHTVIGCLQDYPEMITLNPLVVNYQRCDPLRTAPADEFHCTWFEITDQIKYLPGVSRDVSYKACFYDLPIGLQTHVYAPGNLDIREKWSVGGNMPGEPRQTIELGLAGAPREGLYLREDVNIGCKSFIVSFVKKKLKIAHKELVERLIMRADIKRQLFDIHTNYPYNSWQQSPMSPEGDPCSLPHDSVVLRTDRYDPYRHTECPDTVGIPMPLRLKNKTMAELP